jgi:AraC-like DNA-binding protein
MQIFYNEHFKPMARYLIRNVHMIYSEYHVNGLLSLFIKKLWTLDHSACPTISDEKSVLPNGCFTLVFISGDGVMAGTCREEVVLGQGVYFCGQLTSAIRVRLLPKTRATMVQLYAWAPVFFSKTGMHHLTDRIIPFDEKDLMVDLRTLSDQRILHGVYHHFKACFAPGLHAALIAESSARLMNSAGSLTVQGICSELKCSDRHLEKLFRCYVGLSPKEFAMILMVRNAADDLAYTQRAALSLTALAVKNNFYDQAHFGRRFKRIVRMPPGKFDPADHLLAFKK